VTFTETALWPLSVAYSLGARLRVRLYRAGIFRQHTLKGVVISVGNLTVGGTGKTPMVLWLAERLLAEGKSVAILTRGYRGFLKRLDGEGTAPQTATKPAISGDEPELLVRRIASRASPEGRSRVAVGADRVASGRSAEREGFDWFLLDDGFQHLRLARDLDIVLVDATNPFGGGRVLPSGRLREPKSALRRADIIVITRSTHTPALEAAIRRDSSASIFFASIRLDAISQPAITRQDLPVAEWRTRRFFAFCGIGNPAAFFDDLREWNITPVGTAKFPDHHRYSESDVARLQADAKRAGADALLCTEKDILNYGEARPEGLPVFFARASLAMQNEDAFWSAAGEILAERRPGITL
jgi:tetraacyldisaccharide 4'-kinase